jgi:DNA-binding transcriptional regulator YhcF (GntR family)
MDGKKGGGKAMTALNNDKPVFIQIIEMIEDDILAGLFAPEELIISTPQISKLLSVNPTTAQKAIAVLTDRGIIYKKRGVGMAVTGEAKGMILKERQRAFFDKTLPEFLEAAEKIDISKDELRKIIEEHLHG